MKPTRNLVTPSGFWKTKRRVWYQKNDDEKLNLMKLRLNRNRVQRWVNPETGEHKVVQNGVDDPNSNFLNNPDKYPKQVQAHKDFEEKEPKRERIGKITYKDGQNVHIY